jgi:hypothetical protein
MSHWVISVPLLESEANTRNVLHTRLKFQNLADVSSLKIPSLKIGTLDSLLSLSDDLVKISGEKYEKVRLPEVEKEGSPGSPTPLFSFISNSHIIPISAYYAHNFQLD